MRYASIDAFRTFSIIAVIIIHSVPFGASFNQDTSLYPFIAALLNQLSRFAVPFFFITAGFFLAPKLSGPDAVRRAWQYCLPLLRLWLLWSVFYFVIPFSPTALQGDAYQTQLITRFHQLSEHWLNTLLEGTMIHLWFLPSLIMAVMACAWLSNTRYRRWLLPIAALAYIEGLISGSYAPVFAISPLFDSRDGFFFSFIFVALGILFRRQQNTLSNRSLCWIILLGIVCYTLEVLFLEHYYDVVATRHDYLLGSVPVVTGLFLLLQRYPNWLQGRWPCRVANDVVGIYVVHFIWVIWLMPLGGQWQSQWWELARVPVIFICSWTSWRAMKQLRWLHILTNAHSVRS